MFAVFIGHQEFGAGEFAEPLFNVKCSGHRLDGSTVSAATLIRLGIRELIDRDGKKLLGVPAPRRIKP